MYRQLISSRERGLIPLARRTAVLAALAGIQLGGCGGPSPGNDAPDARALDARPIEFPPASCDAPAAPAPAVPPGVHIVFPPGPALTHRGAITVRGTALLEADVAAIRVNGVLADTTDGFRHWQASVPLQPGANEIKVESEDAAGQIDSGAAQGSVVSGPNPMLRPTAVALDAGNDRALVVDAQRNVLLAVDLTTGLRTIAYQPPESAGAGTSATAPPPPPPPPSSLADVALLEDGRVLVLAAGQLATVNLATNTRAVISDADTGSGPLFESMIDMALDAAQGRVLVVDHEADTLGTVNLTTGARAIISAEGSGPSLSGITGVALDAQAGRALVVTSSADAALLAVNLSTGARTLISGLSRGTGPALSEPEDVVLDAANQRAIVADTSYGRLIAVDLATGNRSLVLEPATSSGFVLWQPSGLALDEAEGRLLVVDGARKALLAVDLAARERSVLSGDAIGSGFELIGPSGFLVDAARRRVLVANQGEPAVVAIDLDSGDRTVLSGEAVGGGPGLQDARALVLDAGGQRLLLASIYTDELLAVELATGQRSVLSGKNVGDGPALSGPQSLLLDEGAGRVLVGTVSGLMAVDLDTGDRSLVTGDVGYVNWLAADPACERVLFTGGGGALTTLYAVDVSTGKVSIAVDEPPCPVSSGTTLGSLAYDPGSGRVLAWQNELSGFVNIDTRSSSCAVQATVGLEDDGSTPGDGSLIMDPATGVLLFASGFTLALEAVDPETGERVILSR